MMTSCTGYLTVLLCAFLLLQPGVPLIAVNDVNVWTSWSSCSKICGPGISTRHCQTNASRDKDTIVLRPDNETCNGSSTQVKLCNMQPCPSDQTSTRQTHCSLYNFRTFSGRKYVWEPFIHPTNPCKLACRAKGEHFYANLPDKAENGTPCKLSTGTAVCVDGVCKQVGCDGVVESAAATDACGVCKGDGSLCQTISGIFTSTGLKPGLNYVISIPGGSTNINITELQASRNFLILQTVDGKYIINNQTSSSSSSAIEAAGTIFRHGAKVFPHRKESITSSGPTNITVVLQILLRGRNPGIFYSFSVPRDVGEAVIQQIKHRSRPIEIPPEHDKDRTVPDSSLRYRNISSMMKHAFNLNHNERPILFPFMKPAQLNHSLDNTKQHKKASSKSLVQKTTLTSYEDTSALDIYESTNLTQLMPTVSKTSDTLANDVTTINLKDTARNKSSLTVARDNTRSHTMLNAKSLFQNQRHNFTFDKSLKSTSLLSVEAEDEVDNLLLNKDSSLNEKSSYHGAVSRSDFVLNKGHGKYGNTENTTDINETDQTGDYATAPVKLSNQIVDNAVKEFHLMFVNDSSHPKKDTSKIFIQPARTPLSRLAALNEIENWNPDGESYYIMDSRNTSVTTTSNTRQNTINADRHDAENTQHASGSVYQAVTYGNKLNSSEYPNKESVSKHTEHGVFSTEKDSSSKVNNVNEDVDRIKALNAHSQHISAGDNPRYVAPRYSQSFKFPHRYKDIYNADLLSGRLSRPKVSFHRQNHSNYTHNFFNVSSKTFSGNSDLEGKHSRRSSSRNVNQVDRSNAHTIALVPSNRDVTSVSSRVSYSNSAIQHSVPDTYQPIETLNRDELNQETNVAEEKRRLEGRINRHNDRIREFQDRMKQKQAEIAASRGAEQKHKETKVDNDTNHLGIGSFQRKTELFGRFSPQQLQTAKDTSSVLPLGIDASFIDSKSNLPHPQDSDSDQIKHEYNETPMRAENNFLPTNSRLTTLQSEHSQHIGDSVFPHLHYPTVPNTHKDRILGRQYVPHEHTNFNYSKQNYPHDPSVDFNALDRNHETSSASRSIHVEPFMVLSQNGETSDTLTEHKPQNGSSNALLGYENPRQEHLAGLPSHRAGTFVSNALSHIPLMNQSWSNELAVDKTVGSNQLENEDPGRQSSLSTHSLVYEWRVSGLTQCTHSCGGGIQQTVIVCVDTVTQAVVTNENCRHFQRPKLLAVPCNTRPCSAEWIPGPWSTCTASCGAGQQTRTVTCQARVSPTLNMTMASSSCEGQDRIPDRQACGTNPCSSWQVGAWSNCSISCGDGHRSRNVSCVDVNGQILSDNICTDIKPHSQEPCNLGECGQGWLFTEWSQCSSDCGAGVVKRQVFCADEKGSTLPDNRCDFSQGPPLTQSCRATKICGALWFTGHWSQCDVKCGSGHKRRLVICVMEQPGSVFSVVGANNCSDVNKPAEIEPCQLSPCAAEWYMTSWSQCSKTCGIGSKTREVRCLDPDHNPADDCPHEARPKTRESCNTHSCSNAIIEGETPDCTDKFNQCSVVKRARLCRYNYYKRVCCKSCAEHISTTIGSDIAGN